MPPSEQEAGHGQPLLQMLALEPCLEFGLAAGTAIVQDRQDAVLLCRHRVGLLRLAHAATLIVPSRLSTMTGE